MNYKTHSILASLLIILGSNIYALPTDGVVAEGRAGITSGAGTMAITQTTQNAVINWQSFNIGQGEAVQFAQPNNNSVALNRVLGADPSRILGNLSSNGKVFLVNPNGILFGKGAIVNVGGLIASTLNISDTDFMAGRYKFSGGPSNSNINNQGSIRADGGFVALLGAQVSNSGVITAKFGSVTLAAGKAITLDVAGDGLLNVTVDQGAVNALIQNDGLIQADGGQVLLTAQAAGNLLQTVVNNSGIIRAQTIENRNGTIMLLGDMQSGTMNVGGTLDASAPNGGNGGFIETSAAHVKVADDARVTTFDANGLAGTWLIDPTDYTIAAVDPTNGSSYMSNATLSTSLGSGNVTIQTLAGGAGNGDIFINGAVTWNSNTTLTLNAHRNININQSITSTGATGALSLLYGQGAVAAGNTATYNIKAPVNLVAGPNFSTRLGSNGILKNYTVITALGVADDATVVPATMTLQGMSGNLGGNYALGSDIDALTTLGWNSGTGFTPVGNSGTPFTGTFEGLGHVICDITISRPAINNVGLFGYTLNSTIRNVGLVNGSVSGLNIVGALVGYNDHGIISNSYATSPVSGGQFVGGLVGGITGGTIISNSYATGDVTGTADDIGGLLGVIGGSGGSNAINNSYATGNVSGLDMIGGLVGSIDDGGGSTISNSYATGTVSGGSTVGGLVGGNTTAAISNSYATGSVTAVGSLVGGLVGEQGVDGSISNSYATGSVTGVTNVGGLAGGLGVDGLITNSYATGRVSGTTNVGGLVGNSEGTITNTYATGSVTGATNVGGLIGDNLSGGSIISYSFWNTTVNTVNSILLPDVGVGSIAGITGLTTAQMRTSSSFFTGVGGFTFTTDPSAVGNNNWVIVNANGTLNNAGGALGATYPMLASEYSTTIYSVHQLQLVQMAVDASYTLGANIAALSTGNSTDVWGSAGFVPIGTNPSIFLYFTGTFDGRGHTISNLFINRPTTDNVGLFGMVGSWSPSISAPISNLGLINPVITGRDNVGGMVGFNYHGTISNSYVASVGLVAGSVLGTTNVGGLVGRNGNAPLGGFGIVNNSYTSALTVTGTTNVGGLVGLNDGIGSITNAYSASAANGVFSVGGLVGNNGGAITNSFWNSGVSASGIGTGSASGSTAMDTLQMQQQLNFTSSTSANNNNNVNPTWNFTNTWVMYNGYTAPLLRVFMAPLRVTASSDSKTYNGLAYYGGNITYGCCTRGLSLLFGTPTIGGPSQGAINVGNYLMTDIGLWSNQQGYVIIYVDGTLTVNPAPLIITANDVGKLYGTTQTFAGTEFTSAGLQNGETITVSLSSTGAAPTASVAGNPYTIVISNSIAALGSLFNVNNYTISYVNGTLTVAPAPLIITAMNASKTYDGLVYTGGNGVTYGGFVNGETIAVLNGALAYGGSSQGAINAGGYLITPSGWTTVMSPGNYIISFVNGKLTILPPDIFYPPHTDPPHTGDPDIDDPDIDVITEEPPIKKPEVKAPPPTKKPEEPIKEKEVKAPPPEIKKSQKVLEALKESIRIPNIEYEFNKAEILEKSKIAIDKTVLALMLENPHIIVEIQAHTDSKGTELYNQELSQRRAESVVNYLMSKGIAANRLVPKGYGESKPVALNMHADKRDNPEGRAKNRRTDFKIIGKLEVELINDAEVQ